MNLDFTEEHLMIRDAARDFAQNTLLEGCLLYTSDAADE